MWLAGLAAALMTVAMACGGSDPTATSAPPTSTTAPAATSTPTPSPTATLVPTPDFPEGFEEIPGIVDPQNFGWPRTVETSSGTVEIPAPPQRVYSLSLGHAEILAALVGADKLVAVSSFFKDRSASAMWEKFSVLPDAGSDPEEIIALEPDLVIASAFTSADLTDQLTSLGIPVVRAELESSALGNIPNILLLGYMLGAEDEALALTDEMRERVESVVERVSEANLERPRVLAISRYVDTYAAGSGSTEGGIIESAGGINAAAESGIVSHQQVSIESIAAINPDIILLTQPEDTAIEFANELYADPALAEVPAIANSMVLYADPTLYTTLSHWNVRGIEEAAKLFFPDLFEGVVFEDFGS